jgi:hypothetical protein
LTNVSLKDFQIINGVSTEVISNASCNFGSIPSTLNPNEEFVLQCIIPNTQSSYTNNLVLKITPE